MKKTLIAIVLTGLLATGSLTACSSQEAVVLSGTGQSHGGDLKVEVTLKGDKIQDIKVVEINDSPGLSEAAAKKMIEKIIKNNSPEGVDTVAGASETSNGVIEAVKDALSKK